MSIRLTRQALKTIAFVGVIAGAVSLSGCTTLGSAAFGDTTGSVGSSRIGSTNQSMPPALGNSGRVASGPYIPPNDIGSGGGGNDLATGSVPMGSVSTESLPVLTSKGTTSKMSAQPSLAPVTVGTKTATLGPATTSSNTLAAPAHNLAVVPANAYIHVIESGESLYTIARHYDVTAQAIVGANGMASADKIFVGQKVIIPGRADLLAAKDASTATSTSKSPAVTAAVEPPKGAINDAKLLETNTPVTAPSVAKPVVASAEPVMSGAEKFRWPVSGKVITDFIASKGTGINISAPEGSAIRAAENGQVIYVGSGVEGYGNLILIRHPNGYVSAYAHLGSMSVVKGDVVNRGDNIGTAGMTGSVSSPQLHFELRKGATPVDPIPLLAT